MTVVALSTLKPRMSPAEIEVVQPVRVESFRASKLVSREKGQFKIGNVRTPEALPPLAEMGANWH